MAESNKPWKPHMGHRPYLYQDCPLCQAMGAANDKQKEKAMTKVVVATDIRPAGNGRIVLMLDCGDADIQHFVLRDTLMRQLAERFRQDFPERKRREKV